MEKLYKLKEMLCDELEEYANKGELSAGSLDVIDKLSHALKSVTTIIAMEDAEGDYSKDYSGGMNRMYPKYYRDSSYARGRRRDSMGRYSRDDYSYAVDDMVNQLHEMVNEAPNEQTKQDILKLIKKFENM